MRLGAFAALSTTAHRVRPVSVAAVSRAYVSATGSVWLGSVAALRSDGRPAATESMWPGVVTPLYDASPVGHAYTMAFSHRNRQVRSVAAMLVA